MSSSTPRLKDELEKRAFMAKLVRHLTSNEEIVSSNLAEGIHFFLHVEAVSFS